MAPAPKDPWAEQPKPQAPSMGRGMWTGTPIPSNPPPPKPTHSEFPSLGRGMAGVGGIPSGGFTPGAEDFPGLGRSVGVGLGRGTGVKGVGIGRGVPLSHTQQPGERALVGNHTILLIIIVSGGSVYVGYPYPEFMCSQMLHKVLNCRTL